MIHELKLKGPSRSECLYNNLWIVSMIADLKVIEGLFLRSHRNCFLFLLETKEIFISTRDLLKPLVMSEITWRDIELVDLWPNQLNELVKLLIPPSMHCRDLTIYIWSYLLIYIFCIIKSLPNTFCEFTTFTHKFKNTDFWHKNTNQTRI